MKSDSQLACKTVNGWLRGWQSAGWQKQNGNQNLDIFKLLDSLLSLRTVQMLHVRAHTGKKDYETVHNNIADQLASRAIVDRTI